MGVFVVGGFMLVDLVDLRASVLVSLFVTGFAGLFSYLYFTVVFVFVCLLLA